MTGLVVAAAVALLTSRLATAEQDAPPPPPADETEPLRCQGPAEVKAVEHVILRCTAKPGLRVASVFVYYRQLGQEDYDQLPTLKTPAGWWKGDICPHVFTGRQLQYYFEAKDERDQVVAQSGNDESPHLVFRAVEVPAITQAVAGQGRARDEDPLVLAQRERERALAAARPVVIPRRRERAIFAGLGVGAGYGWHPRAALDFRDDQEVAPRLAAAGTVLVTPEVGYQLTKALAVSAQLRYQFIESRGFGDSHEGAPPENAWALFSRAQYGFVGRGRMQLFASASFGVGSGFRLVVPPVPEMNLRRNDSVRGGPFVLGPGFGVEYHLARAVAWMAEVKALAGLPNFAVVADVGTGLRIAY